MRIEQPKEILRTNICHLGWQGLFNEIITSDLDICKIKPEFFRETDLAVLVAGTLGLELGGNKFLGFVSSSNNRYIVVTREFNDFLNGTLVIDKNSGLLNLQSSLKGRIYQILDNY